MKLTELINYFRAGNTLEKLCTQFEIDPDSEAIEVYSVQPITLESELRFFEIEKTQGQLDYTAGETTYHNLFDMYYFLDLIEDLKETGSVEEDEKIAEAVLSYALNDA